MKNTILLKSLIDFFYIISFIGLIIILSNFIVSQDHLEWSFIKLSILLVNIISYSIFLRGLFFLRGLGRIFIYERFLQSLAVVYFKKSGYSFLLASTISLIKNGFLTAAYFFDYNFIKEPSSVSLSDSVSPIFLMIIGLLFIVQSRALSQAIAIKEDNTLII